MLSFIVAKAERRKRNNEMSLMDLLSMVWYLSSYIHMPIKVKGNLHEK